MPSPFPGMDPYLEHPALWPDVHNKLISEAQTYLNRLIRPKYVARVDERRYVSIQSDPGRAAISPAFPDAYLVDNEIAETYLTIQEPPSTSAITVLEVLSHTNKIHRSAGSTSYLQHRDESFESGASWIEIDLLRPTVTKQTLSESGHFDYQIAVVRGNSKGRVRCYLLGVQDSLPTIGVPLKADEPDVALDLKSILQIAYDAAGYEERIDYSKPPTPPLSPADEKWADALLRKSGLR